MATVELRPAEVVTVRRLAADEAGPSLVRFAHGGVLVDPGAGAALELAEDELVVLDQVGWRGRGVDRDELTAVLEPLAAAGIDLRSADDGAAGPAARGRVVRPARESRRHRSGDRVERRIRPEAVRGRAPVRTGSDGGRRTW